MGAKQPQVYAFHQQRNSSIDTGKQVCLTTHLGSVARTSLPCAPLIATAHTLNLVAWIRVCNFAGLGPYIYISFSVCGLVAEGRQRASVFECRARARRLRFQDNGSLGRHLHTDTASNFVYVINSIIMVGDRGFKSRRGRVRCHSQTLPSLRRFRRSLFIHGDVKEMLRPRCQMVRISRCASPKFNVYNIRAHIKILKSKFLIENRS